jgi:hypothetical protein
MRRWDAAAPAAGDEGTRELEKRQAKRRVEEGVGPASVAADGSMVLVVNGGVRMAASTKRERPVMRPRSRR